MIRLKGFMGAIPVRDKAALPPGFAQKASRCDLLSGVLQPLPGWTNLATVGGIYRALYYLAGAWRGYPLGTKVIPGPVATDRFYISQPSASPSVVSYAGTVFDRVLALPAPTAAPNYAMTGTFQQSNFERIRFATTFLTDLGEESPPSPMSAVLSFSPGWHTVQISASSDGLPAGRGIVGRNVYRTVTDFAGNATLHYVGHLPIGTTNFTYTFAGAPIQEPIPSVDYDPPLGTLQNFTAMPNGIVVGSSGRNVCFCEPFILHAWPEKYRLLTDDPIVGFVAFNNSLAVLTTGAPYLITGSHPANMTMVKFEGSLGCVAAGSIVDRGYGGLYASMQGLVEIDESGARVVTDKLLGLKGWKALNPRNIKSAVFAEGRYTWVGDVIDGDDTRTIDLSGEEPYLLSSLTQAHALALDPQGGSLVALDNVTADGVVRQVRSRDNTGAAGAAYEWRSGILTEGYLTNYAWAMVRTTPGLVTGDSITVKLLIGPSAEEWATIATPNTPIRLPAGRMEQEFEVVVTGNANVREIAFAHSPEELVGA